MAFTLSPFIARPRNVVLASSRSRALLNRRGAVAAAVRLRHLATVDPPQSPPPYELGSGSELSASFVYSLLGSIIATLPILPANAEVPPALVEAFKSTPASLGHPIGMWLMFASILYTFWLGWQTREVRSAEPERRKELVKAKVGRRHFEISATIFALVTIFTFTGMANTYTRTGKLFPGPHLYAGLSLVALLATMSSFAPKMLEGKLWARNAHFTLAFGVVALFGWQAKTGMDIVAKLLGWE